MVSDSENYAVQCLALDKGTTVQLFLAKEEQQQQILQYSVHAVCILGPPPASACPGRTTGPMLPLRELDLAG
jgi:hypothetical protein